MKKQKKLHQSKEITRRLKVVIENAFYDEFKIKCETRYLSMFGSYRLFCNDIPIMLITNTRCYVRFCVSERNKILNEGYDEFINTKNNLNIRSGYFSRRVYSDEDMVMDAFRFIRININGKFNVSQPNVIGIGVSSNKMPHKRIRDLANLRFLHEQLLKKVGVTTIQELESMGAVKALHLILSKSELANESKVLFDLAGAILNRHAATFKDEFKSQLLRELTEYKYEQKRNNKRLCS